MLVGRLGGLNGDKFFFFLFRPEILLIHGGNPFLKVHPRLPCILDMTGDFRWLGPCLLFCWQGLNKRGQSEGPQGCEGFVVAICVFGYGVSFYNRWTFGVLTKKKGGYRCKIQKTYRFVNRFDQKSNQNKIAFLEKKKIQSTVIKILLKRFQCVTHITFRT